jgi:hypothetical protein
MNMSIFLLPAAGFLLSIVVSLTCTATKKSAGSFYLVSKAPLGVWGCANLSCVKYNTYQTS